MPRKVNKVEQSYWLLKGHKELIDQIVSEKSLARGAARSHDQNWIIKYYTILDYIVSIYFNDKDSTSTDMCSKFVNVNQRYMSDKLGVDKSQISAMLDNLIEANILTCDNIFEMKNKSTGKPGKSYGYKINNYCHSKIEKVIVLVPAQIINKLESFEKDNLVGKNLNNYKKILDKISLSISDINNLKQTILNNKYSKLFSNTLYNFKYKQVSNTVVYPLGVVLVPESENHVEEKVGTNTIIPGCQVLMNFVDAMNTLEDDDKTIARIDRAVYIINNQKMIPNRRKREDSRVYCDLTNLNRELRKAVRINGKPIIGMDIRNSQPLIFAVMLMVMFKDQEIPKDVKEYINNCENGSFYDEFMNMLNITDKKMRQQFKVDFFNRVFFSKHIEKDNELKRMFREKYPTVWQIICDEKGGMYSKDFNQFATQLQMFEAQIMFDTIQGQLMDMGIDCYNNFDSLYFSSMEDYETAKKITMDVFTQIGVKPTINPERYDLDTDVQTIEEVKCIDETVEVRNEFIGYVVVNGVSEGYTQEEFNYAWDRLFKGKNIKRISDEEQIQRTESYLIGMINQLINQ